MAYTLDTPPAAQAREYWIPPGHAGIEATVRHMRRITRRALRSPLLVEEAARIVAGAGTDEARARRIRAYLEERTRFVPDPQGVELIKTPRYMLREIGFAGIASGDCDDVAVFGAALGRAVGLPARFVLFGFDAGPFSHVFTELGTEDGWLELDTTRPAQMPEGIEIVRRGVREA